MTEEANLFKGISEPKDLCERTLDLISEGCQIISPDWRYLYVNDAVAKHGKRAKDELLGARITDVYPGIAETEVFRQMQRCMKSREPHTMDTEFTYPDGTKGYFRLKIQPVPEGILVTSTDVTEKAHAQDDLERIFEMSLDMICIADLETATFTMVNPAFTQVLGFSESELLRKPFFDFIHPDDIESTRNVFEEALRQGKKVIDFKNRYRCKDGSYRWLRWVSHPCLNAGVTFAMAHDISEEIQKEALLNQSKHLLDSMGSIAKVGGWELDARTMEVTWTEETYHLHEVPLGSKPPLEDAINFFHPDEREKLSVAIRSALEQGKPYDLEVRFITAKGKHLWTRTICHPEMEDGRVVKLIGVFQDITERKKAEAELQWSQEDLRRSQSLAKLGSWRLDIASNEVVWSEELYKMYDADPTLPPPPYTEHMKLFTPESWEKLSSELAITIETGKSYELELETVRLDGGNGWMWVRGEAELDANGRVTGVWGAAQDITERKEAEEREEELQAKLSRAERMESLGVLAGGVAHDLNNTLGPLVILPELLAEDLEDLENLDIEQVMQTLSTIRDSAERSARVVRDLVSLGRRGRYNLVEMNISEIDCVSPDCGAIKELIKTGSNIQLLVQAQQDDLVILGDETHLSRAVTNVVRNAVESISHEGTVTIKTFRKSVNAPLHAHEIIPRGAYAVIEIADTGEGMDEERINRIFEPFFTKKRKSARSGSGLGLSVVHGIIHDHNGFIDVQSEVGKGSVFSLYLPLTDRSKEERDGSSPEPVIGGTERILIVDDEPSQRFLCRKALERSGYKVAEAEHGQQALAHFWKAKQAGEESPYDLVVLDMIMEEGFDGLDTYEAVLKLFPNQKCIIASGHADNERAQDAVGHGARWLGKPYSKDALARAVRECLDE